MAQKEGIQKTASLTALAGIGQELCHVPGDAEEAPPEVCPVCELGPGSPITSRCSACL